MANNNETTTKFRVDISELKRAMQEAKRSIAVTNSEFKAVASTMDDWSKSTDGISAKLSQLDSNLKSQKTILKSLEDQYELTVREMGEGSKAADDLKIKINNQKAVINQTEREISNYEDSLKEVAEAEKIAAKTGKSVAEVLEDVGNEAEDAGDGFTTLKGAVATFAGNALTGLVSGLKNAASNLLGLAESTREYRDQMSKLDAASQEAGYGTEYAMEKYKELYGVLGDETAANTTISNFMAMGLEQGQLNGLLNSATGIWAKYGDSIPLDGLAESINETAKVGQVTGGLADALNWAGVSEDEFNERLAECTSEQARQRIILGILNKNYGELGENYKETNKDVIAAREAQADYTEVLASMGEKIEPVTTAVKVGFTGLLQEALKLVEGVDMAAFTAKIQEGFGVLKDDVLPAVKDGLGWIIENKDIIIAGLTGIATGFVAFKVATLIQGVAKAMQGMTIAQYALNLAMSLNPIGLVVAAIAGLVAAFIVLWNKSESFRNFWINLWNKIKEFTSDAAKSIGKFFTETIPTAIDKMVTFLSELPSKVWKWLLNTINKVIEWRSNMISKAKETASNFVSNIISYLSQLPSKAWSWLSGTISKAGTFASNLAQKGREAAKGLYDNIVGYLSDLPSKFVSIGSDVIGGLWSGISGAIGGLYDNIKNSLSGLVGKAKKALGINSPSKVFANEVGKWIPEGIAVGIDKNAKSALSSIKGLTTDAVGAARGGLSTAATAIGSKSVTGGVVNNFTQVINSPKQLSRLDIYRQSKNLLGYAGGGA